MRELINRLCTYALIVIIAFLIYWCANFTASAYQESLLTDNFLRIDIKSNSNCLRDQEIKLKVKKEITNDLNKLIKNHKLPVLINQEFYKSLFYIQKFLIISMEKVLQEEKAAYGVKIEITQEQIQEKIGNKFPVLKVYLGQARQEEKWTLYIPPLCYTVNQERTLINPASPQKVEIRIMLWELFKKLLK